MAHRLVTCASWPGEEATADEVTQLALLRLLWLQREVHNCAETRHREAAALLARSSVETCLVGLYCLHVPGAVERMRGTNARSLDRIFAFMAGEDFFLGTFFDAVVSSLGGPEVLPTAREMAEKVSQLTEHSIAVDLYRRIYVPLSSFFAHGTGIALLRHVTARDEVRTRPMFPWSLRSSIHTADACMGILATHLSASRRQDNVLFVEYANAHWARTLLPVVATFGRSIPRGLQWSKLPHALMTIWALRRYLSSDGVAHDSSDVREARVRADVERLVEVLPAVSDSLKVVAVEEMTKALLAATNVN